MTLLHIFCLLNINIFLQVARSLCHFYFLCSLLVVKFNAFKRFGFRCKLNLWSLMSKSHVVILRNFSCSSGYRIVGTLSWPFWF